MYMYGCCLLKIYSKTQMPLKMSLHWDQTRTVSCTCECTRCDSLADSDTKREAALAQTSAQVAHAFQRLWVLLS